ncbi:MAG: hypothetical protein H6727_07375 [Myxococcales bacterium]|nr:hypothetical protein [Myxococcales bacterium]
MSFYKWTPISRWFRRFGCFWYMLFCVCMVFLGTFSTAWAQNPTLPGGLFPEREATPKNVIVLRPQQLDKGLEALSPESRNFVKSDEMDVLRRQLGSDPIPIPPRLGALFVPRIIQQQNVAQTSYIVYDMRGRQVAMNPTGKKAFVYPGRYIVQIGSRAGTILPRYRVRVYASQITIIRARWAALVVLVQDEALVQFRATYDLIHLNSRRGVGTGIGADERIGEKVRPWLVPPGLYMLVRVGDTYLARTNYFTVQVNEGEVTFFRLVVDRNDGSFRGGGVLLLRQLGLDRRGAWTWSLQLSGNFLWNNVSNPSTPPAHRFSLTTFLSARATYNTERHFFRSFLNVELGFTIPNFTDVNQIDLQKSADRVELEAIYIYRILSFLGPYARVGLETTIFPSAYYVTDTGATGTSLFRCETETVCALVRDNNGNAADRVGVGDFLDPLLFKQGIGINLQALQYSWLDLRLLVGFGFRQEVARSVFQASVVEGQYTTRCADANLRDPAAPWDTSKCSNPAEQELHNHLRFFRKTGSHREGIELAVVATGQITRFLTFTTEFDMLAQFADIEDLDITWRTTITLRLSHFASLFYRLRIRRDPATITVNKWSLDQSLVLSFSILL